MTTSLDKLPTGLVGRQPGRRLKSRQRFRCCSSKQSSHPVLMPPLRRGFFFLIRCGAAFRCAAAAGLAAGPHGGWGGSTSQSHRNESGEPAVIVGIEIQQALATEQSASPAASSNCA